MRAWGSRTLPVASAINAICSLSNTLIWSDVLVNAEKVIWIVLPLNFHKAIVIISVGCFDPVDSLVHHEVYVGAPQAVRMQCRPVVFGPGRYLFGVCWVRIYSDNDHRPLRIAITESSFVAVHAAHRTVYRIKMHGRFESG